VYSPEWRNYRDISGHIAQLFLPLIGLPLKDIQGVITPRGWASAWVTILHFPLTSLSIHTQAWSLWCCTTWVPAYNNELNEDISKEEPAGSHLASLVIPLALEPIIDTPLDGIYWRPHRSSEEQSFLLKFSEQALVLTNAGDELGLNIEDWLPNVDWELLCGQA
jgi:hypothetical protein